MAYPEYRDRRGKRVTFRPALRVPSEVTSVTGERTAHGLVLHRMITTAGMPRCWFKWTISDPVSGLRIVHGRTRQDALDELAHRVALIGGEAAFLSRVRECQLSQPLQGSPLRESHTS